MFTVTVNDRRFVVTKSEIADWIPLLITSDVSSLIFPDVIDILLRDVSFV